MFTAEKFNWCYQTEPNAGLRGRRVYWPRGKTLGGSSAINGMVHTRGNRLDYDHWAELGNHGWSWDDVLPYFKKSENNARGENEYRGIGGPLSISDPAVRHPALDDFIDMAAGLGVDRVDDLSTCGTEGVGILQATILNGKRCSAYDAYIAPVLSRKNLTVISEAQVLRILFEDTRATGVEFLQEGNQHQAGAAREVLLCAGALNSPHLLMLSGVGCQAHLKSFGIQPVMHLPGVGKNLQDHCSVHIKARTCPSNSYNRNLQGWRKYLEGMKYLTTGTGYLALGSSQAAAFVRSRPDVSYADLEISFRPMTFTFDEHGGAKVDPYDAISAAVYRVRPESRGEVLLQSADPRVAPLFHANYLSVDEDRQAMVAGIRFFRSMIAAKSDVYTEVAPGPQATTDEQLMDYVETHAKCAYHPAGTCKMGRDDMAVVDDQLRVKGTRNLRVIDASIMPTVTSGNTNAPTIMIGEKGASFVQAVHW